jgi:hypothetical protein
MVVETGAVNSGTMHQPVSLLCPTSDNYAKLVVDSLGCGKQVVIPHLGHAVSAGFTDYLPEEMFASMLRSETKKVVGVYAKYE